MRGKSTHLPQMKYFFGRGSSVVLLLLPIILVTRPLMYVAFWISEPAMEARAKAIMNEPYSNPCPGPARVGLYYVYFSKCPHGVAMYAFSPENIDVLRTNSLDRYVVRWDPSMFVYKPVPGDCDRYQSGRPLGGDWHIEGW